MEFHKTSIIIIYFFIHYMKEYSVDLLSLTSGFGHTPMLIVEEQGNQA